MKESLSMSSDDLRMEDVPSLEDLETIEAYVDPEEDKGNMFRGFVQDKILGELVEKDDRYDETRRNLSGNEFEYHDIRGALRHHFGSISGRVFRPEGRDISDKDLGMIGAASLGDTTHNKATSKYQSALKKAGYELDDSSVQELVETANKALDDIDSETFSIDIENNTREAYGEAVKKIQEYREGL